MADNIIVDGHHRFICLSILGLNPEKISWVKSPSTLTIPWQHVEIITKDWETEEQIKKHEEKSKAR